MNSQRRYAFLLYHGDLLEPPVSDLPAGGADGRGLLRAGILWPLRTSLEVTQAVHAVDLTPMVFVVLQNFSAFFKDKMFLKMMHLSFNQSCFACGSTSRPASAQV